MKRDPRMINLEIFIIVLQVNTKVIIVNIITSIRLMITYSYYDGCLCIPYQENIFSHTVH